MKIQTIATLKVSATSEKHTLYLHDLEDIYIYIYSKKTPSIWVAISLFR